MPQRIFLNWNKPLLPPAAEWLIDRYKHSKNIELSNVICVTPAGRGGRLLLKHLLLAAQAQSRLLVPPHIVTPGVLIEAACPNLGPLAEKPEQLAAWRAALTSLPSSAREEVFPDLEQRQDFISLHAIAESLAELHDQLAGGGCTFASVVVCLAQNYADLPGEQDRWEILNELQDEYYKQLTKCGLVDPMQAKATAGPDLEAGEEMVLIGVTDLNSLQRKVLGHFGDRVTTIVHAPEGLAERFDEYGCITPERWCNQLVDIKEDMIVVVDRPPDQTQAVLDTMAGFNGRYSAGEITVGLGDEGLGSLLEQRGAWAGVSFHAAEGRLLSKSPPCLLLQAIADWREEPRFATFAALLRHPDLERWVRAEVESEVTDWISLLDRYFQDHLDERFAGEWLGKQGPKLKLVYDGVIELLHPLGSKRLRQGEWGRPILAVLKRVYGERLSRQGGNESDRICRESCQWLRDLLAGWSVVSRELQVAMSAVDAIRLLLSEAAKITLGSPVRRDQVEMLGWLELHLDDAPALILTGVNDGFIPGSLAGDAFLPESLRSRLGLPDNDARYARDAYLIQAMGYSRENAVFITGRRGSDGDGLIPSRLLLAGADETMVERVQRMCGQEETRASTPVYGLPRGGGETAFVPPALPADLEPPQSMSVTSFRDYLYCPYRYALKHLLKLRSVKDEAAELDAMQFGILAHEVLCAFGEDKDATQSTDPDKIESYLRAELTRLVREKHGRHPIPSVRVQQARLERRLVGFARFQAEHRAAGWEIRHCEWSFDENSNLDIPEQEPMLIRGKIDRIDARETSEGEEFFIIDYKTGDSAKSPHQAHHEGRKTISQEWSDLQLPLYHFLAGQRDIKGAVSLGFMVLPKKVDGAKLLRAEWSEDDLAGALEAARGVVRDIRAGKFEMNSEKSHWQDDFASICYANALRAEIAEEEEEKE